MTVVVTGGNGFIGSHLVSALVGQKREVVVASDFSRDGAEKLERLGLNIGDIGIRDGDLGLYSNALKAVRGAGTVFHLAARVGSLSYLHGTEAAELAALHENLTIDANVFRACLEEGVERLVYASSVAVYSMGPQASYDTMFSECDLMSVDPDGGYGWSKLVGEIQLGWLRSLKCGIARLFNIYGVNEPLEPSRAHAVADISIKILSQPDGMVTIAGDGRQNRDFLYVTDCVAALLKLEQSAASPPVIVNVGSGRPVSVRSLAQKIVELSGCKTRLRFDGARPCGPHSRTANITKAKSALGWEPLVPFDEGLSVTIDWIKKSLTGSSMG